MPKMSKISEVSNSIIDCNERKSQFASLPINLLPFFAFCRLFPVVGPMNISMKFDQFFSSRVDGGGRCAVAVAADRYRTHKSTQKSTVNHLAKCCDAWCRDGLLTKCYTKNRQHDVCLVTRKKKKRKKVKAIRAHVAPLGIHGFCPLSMKFSWNYKSNVKRDSTKTVTVSLCVGVCMCLLEGKWQEREYKQ